jgi:hypothetical protein
MNYELPTLTDRVKSTLVDAVLIFILMGVVSEVFNLFTNVPDSIRIGTMIMMILYDPIFTSTTCTLGQKLAGVRVRNFEKLHNDNQEVRIGFFQAALRIVVKSILGGVTVISYFVNDEKRMLQDFASGSIVIKK